MTEHTPDPAEVIAKIVVKWDGTHPVDYLLDREDAEAVILALEARGYRVVRTDPTPEIAALLAAQEPHVCRSCGGSGWVDDENWHDVRWARGEIEREEWDGLIPCGVCDGGRDLDRDERTEPTMVVDGWDREQEARVVELLRASVVRTDPDHPTVEIGGQVMTQAQYDAARFPLLNPSPAAVQIDHCVDEYGAMGVVLQVLRHDDVNDPDEFLRAAAARALRGEAQPEQPTKGEKYG